MNIKALSGVPGLRHLEEEHQSPQGPGTELQLQGALDFGGVVALEALLLTANLSLHAEHVGLPACGDTEQRGGLAGGELRAKDVAVLVDLDLGRHRGHLVRDHVRPLVPAIGGRLRAAQARAVVRLQATLPGHDPALNEPQRLLGQVVLGVIDSRPCGHELDGATAQRLLVALGVLVRKLSVHYEGHDLHVAVRVLTKSALALHKVIVHHTQDTEVAGPFMVLREAEVEPRLQPVLVRPALSRGICRVPRISKPARIGLAGEEAAFRDHVQGHGARRSSTTGDA
eukprot:CAMPEP_0181444500 /NCGR_PEP_ID=MMETSP1110-20121109/25101_1 /TAXON_ID=174948 /ORGANISM="Symbiodinium sp., Strain CCMP421" /LENGTH=283 /DNA_ID=CAMNT_0023568509 /DNA_START=157 /DNA_END=1009 /DNA_ORIENTATION=-